MPNLEFSKHEVSKKIAEYFVLMLNSQREVTIPKVGTLKVSDKTKKYTFVPSLEFDKQIRF